VENGSDEGSHLQAGQDGHAVWCRQDLLESEPMPKILDPLMGWTGSRDTMEQVQLWFHTLDEAKAYAEKSGWHYTVEQPHARHIRPKAYADNFAYTRVGRWTH
jgi:hypothetical protein